MKNPPKQPSERAWYGAAALLAVAVVLMLIWVLDSKLPGRSSASRATASGQGGQPLGPEAAEPGSTEAAAAAPPPGDVSAEPPAAHEVVRQPGDKPAQQVGDFDPNEAFPDEGPMRVIDDPEERRRARDRQEHVPSAEESLGMTDKVIARLERELADLEARGDTERAGRVKIRLQRLRRERAQRAREISGAGGGSGTTEP